MSKASKFNRLVMLGIQREQLCLAVFTSNIDSTKTLLQYFPHMTPGTEALILNRVLRGVIGDTNTALVSSAQPLIPLKPYTPITQNEEYSFFNFVTKNLQTGRATLVNNVYNCVVYDGSGNKNRQCCIAAANRAIGLHTEIYCSELDMNRVDVPLINFCSVAISQVLLIEKMDVMVSCSRRGRCSSSFHRSAKRKQRLLDSELIPRTEGIR